MKIFSQMWADRAKAHSTKAKECLDKACHHSKREHAAVAKKVATTRKKSGGLRKDLGRLDR